MNKLYSSVQLLGLIFTAETLVVLLISCLILTGGAMRTLAQQIRPAYALGNDRHVFVDNFLIEKRVKVILNVNPPQRKELVIIADKPWEAGGITSYCNVFWDDQYKEYRLYYVPIHLDSKPAYRLAMATSKDGIHWDKPNLGVVEWQGSKDNNIVIDSQREGTVMIDPNGAPDKRYVFLSTEPSIGARLFTSPDGIHFTMQPTQLSGHHSDRQISTFWDAQLRRYVHYH